MNIRSLQAFTEVVRQNGFSAAAKLINATQSTVSKAVKQLEEEVGAVLIDRSSSNIRLTQAGEVVYRRAISILTERDDMCSELEELAGLKRGVLNLGLPPIGSSVLFAPVFADYTKQHPEVDIKLLEHGSKRLEELLLAGDLELAASLLPVSDVFDWQDVRREPIMALVSESTPTKNAETITLQELANMPFILFESGFAINPIILGVMQKKGLSPHIAVRSSQIDFIIELVAAGMGVGFLPRMIAELRQHRQVKIMEIRGADVYWHMALIWRRNAFLSHAARAWLELCQKVDV